MNLWSFEFGFFKKRGLYNEKNHLFDNQGLCPSK